MKYKSSLAFLLGFLSCAVLSFLFFSDISTLTGFIVAQQKSPSNWLNESNVLLYDDKVIIELANASISSYAQTGSMDPLLGKDASGIRIKPSSPDQIDVGDIISFRNSSGELIVHRVVKKGLDREGVYFITKGDQNFFSDGKVRFDSIEYITVGVLW